MPHTRAVARVRGRDPMAMVAATATAFSVGLSALAAGSVALSPTTSRGPVTTASTATPVTAARAQHSLGQSVRFEPNVGQTDASVGFLTHSGGATVFLSPTQVTWSRVRPQPPSSGARHGRPHAPAPGPGNALRMQLVGGNAGAAATTADTLPGVANYLLGNDPARWHTDVPTFGRIVFHAVYPGIDLAWYGNRGQLEYDFIVAPGADPSLIDMAFAGAERMGVDAHNGDLVLVTSVGEARQHAPRVFQDVDGVRTPVTGAFTQHGDHIGFELGPYDHARTLDVDPIVGYSTLLGGSSGSDFGWSVALDRSGSAYVMGGTGSSDFPTAPGAFKSTAGDLFVSKLTPDGSALAYSTYFGGSPGVTPGGSFSQPVGIALDPAGNAIVDGWTIDVDFPTTPGAFQTSCGAACSHAYGFVTKLNASGSSLLYSTYLGGTGGTEVEGLAVDRAGDAFVSGPAFSADFPTTPGAYKTTCGTDGNCNGTADGFLTKLNPTGSGLLYSTFVGGSGADCIQGCEVAVDTTGSAYVGGGTTSTDLPTTPGALRRHACRRSLCGFIAKFDAGGTSLLYATYLGGSLRGASLSGTSILTITVDGSGNAYVGGETDTADFPVTPGAFQPAIVRTSGCPVPCADGFLAKLNAGGTGLLYSTFFGGIGSESVSSIALDGTGGVWLTTSTPDFAFHSRDAVQETCGCFVSSPEDTVLAKLRPAGAGAADLLFSSYLGGTGDDLGHGVAVDTRGNAYITGQTTSPDPTTVPPGGTPVPYPTTPGAFQTSRPASKFPGFPSAFVTKVMHTCSAPLSGSISGDVVIGPGSAGCLYGARVSGSVIVQRGGDLSVDNSRISGSVLAAGATSVTVCATTVGSGVSVSGATGVVRVGSGDAPGCNIDHITGDVILKNNRGGVELGGDTITGSAAITGNTGFSVAWDDVAPEVEGNRISGNLVCTANSPAPIDDLLRNRAATKSGQCASL